MRPKSEEEKPFAAGRSIFVGDFRDVRKVAPFKGSQRIFEK